MDNPTPIKSVVSFEAIPAELKELNQWCCWKLEYDDKGKLTKVPYNPAGYKASSTDSETWASFEAVKAAYEDQSKGFSGVGFIFNNDYTGTDFDHCIIIGEIADPLTVDCLKKLNSYTEISPSGDGVHCLAEGTIPKGHKKGNYEMYSSGRFFTMTGNVVNSCNTDTKELRADQSAIDEVYKILFPANKPDTAALVPYESMAQITAMRDLNLSVDRIIELASTAKNKDKFLPLMAGSSAGYKSDSEADEALAFILAFYTNDHNKILQIIRQSGLWDEKWERDDYQERTIGKALELVTEKYNGLGVVERPNFSAITEEQLQSIKVDVAPPITVNLEPDNFISQYINYGKYSCDAYPEYHLGMALSLLSIAANRNLVIRLMQLELYTNIWIFILGPSTIARKSVAIGLAEKLLKRILKAYRLSESHSPEGFIEELSEMPKAYYIKDEVSSLLAAMEKPYMGEMRELLCNLYDCRGESRKLRTSQRSKKSSFDIDDPYISEVCATTGESFKELTTKLDITSGWLVRFLYFYPTYKKESRPFELANGESDLLFSSVLARYKGIVDKLFNLTQPRTVQFEPDAFEFYQKWQMRREAELQANLDQDNIKNALWGRLQAYALKLAALFTVGRSDYTIETKISLRYVTEACRVIDDHFLPTSLRVAEMVAMEETKNLQNRVISILRQHGGKIARKRLLQILHLKLSDVEDALEGLIESEEISLVPVSNKTGGKPTFWIVLNQINNMEKSEEEKKQDKEIEGNDDSDSTDSIHSHDSRVNSSIVNIPIPATNATIETNGTFVTVETPIKPNPNTPCKVRFLKDYRTQIPCNGLPDKFEDKLYLKDELAEIPAYRAKDLIKREIVEAST